MFELYIYENWIVILYNEGGFFELLKGEEKYANERNIFNTKEEISYLQVTM